MDVQSVETKIQEEGWAADEAQPTSQRVIHTDQFYQQEAAGGSVPQHQGGLRSLGNWTS